MAQRLLLPELKRPLDGLLQRLLVVVKDIHPMLPAGTFSEEMSSFMRSKLESPACADADCRSPVEDAAMDLLGGQLATLLQGVLKLLVNGELGIAVDPASSDERDDASLRQLDRHQHQALDHLVGDEVTVGVVLD